MQAKLSMLFLVTFAIGVQAQSFSCCTKEPSSEHIEMSKRLAGLERDKTANGFSGLDDEIKVATYFQVVAASNKVADGYLTMLLDQLAVMNPDFSPYQVSYDLIETTRTINSRWSEWGDATAMKLNLRNSDYISLNMHLISSMFGALGLCFLPTNITTKPEALSLDSCGIVSSTVPSSDNTHYNLRKTSVHEIGHWFGLYRPSRTVATVTVTLLTNPPPQASFSEGSPISRDSCPDYPGLDSIHNYMDCSVE
ncbi:metalloprotease [Colletotrichum gloeosporioides Cg-14]|uniref:Metalloprotease n=1 Tax=Colletotrichum gloeosporioides (strain Cg-14) TaxID=1237896 RepID=T0LBW4_COLGC|nr:metalloprotease [Colletotrichum gloeosporioides Cg-14]